MDNANKQSTKPDIKDEFTDNKLYTKEKKTNSGVISDTTEDSDKTYDDPTGSQYVYSESSKDFKLSVSNESHEDEKNIHEMISTTENALTENVKDTKDISKTVSTTKDAPIEKIEDTKNISETVLTTEDAATKKMGESDALRDDAKQLQANKSNMSQRSFPDCADKEVNPKSDACHLNNNVPVEKADKHDIHQQNDVAKQVPVERRTKSTDQKTTKDTSVKGLTHKEKAQTKQDILTSKIKAHAEKEISAIKEGFAIKDGLKNTTKPLGIGPNPNIRQKPPSQEVCKKQDKPLNDDTDKVFSPSTAATTDQPVLPQKNMKYNEKAKEKIATTIHQHVSTSKISSTKMTENQTVQKDKTCMYLTEDTTVKPQSLECDNLSKGADADRATLENTSLRQLQNESSEQDSSIAIMGIMVTVRERVPLESKREENKEQEVCHYVKCYNTDKHVETDITSLSDKVSVNQTKHVHDYNEKQPITRETGTKSTLKRAEKNVSDRSTEESSQQKRPQRETQLPHHLAEKVVAPTLTVPAKNTLLAETQPLPNKQDIIAEETKVYANKPPNAALETTGTEGQIESRTNHEMLPTIEMNRLISVSTTNNEKTQEDTLHIDSIAIRVVPAVTEEEDEIRILLLEEGYFQVDKRDMDNKRAQMLDKCSSCLKGNRAAKITAKQTKSRKRARSEY
ncbi:hypothetical protein WMY93_007205 [Mugilogobius chulae]|uniref:Uncharacterized protein n=1 Tax=Mugilogobius chulae TaxID=88201 RepID=A0AAW0PLZ6_9GOBI